ncbi:MAG: PIN domain-containing protein [Candidatus Aenigmarchaeota archaeon]|nr:PIN domain-containing protein [Candidatus Aenigmarchaeota archaeon]MBU5689224.1 PIN domain-containing protein [Candidatus Aenigmarchaeota archaeon]
MRVYLDTNIVFGFFKRFLESKFMKKQFRLPEKMLIANKAKDVYISELVLSEVVSGMKKWCEKNEIKLSKNEIESLVQEFRKEFKIKILKKVEIKDLFLLVNYGIDINDGIHLEISKNRDMVFVTDDKRLYEAGKYFYGKVLSFHEFRKLVNGPTQN